MEGARKGSLVGTIEDWWVKPQQVQVPRASLKSRYRKYRIPGARGLRNLAILRRTWASAPSETRERRVCCMCNQPRRLGRYWTIPREEDDPRGFPACKKTPQQKSQGQPPASPRPKKRLKIAENQVSAKQVQSKEAESSKPKEALQQNGNSAVEAAEPKEAEAANASKLVEPRKQKQDMAVGKSVVAGSSPSASSSSSSTPAPATGSSDKAPEPVERLWYCEPCWLNWRVAMKQWFIEDCKREWDGPFGELRKGGPKWNDNFAARAGRKGVNGSTSSKARIGIRGSRLRKLIKLAEHARRPPPPSPLMQPSSDPSNDPSAEEGVGEAAGKHFDFIEIGTSCYHTFTQAITGHPDGKPYAWNFLPWDRHPLRLRGLAVDMQQNYLDQLPDLPRVTKVNAAITENGRSQRKYHVLLGDVEHWEGRFAAAGRWHGFRTMRLARGCSALTDHTMLRRALSEIGLSHLGCKTRVKTCSMGTLLRQHGVASIGMLALDCEGHDCSILKGLLRACKENPAWFPKWIWFESNGMNDQLFGRDTEVKTVRAFERVGYEIRWGGGYRQTHKRDTLLVRKAKV